MPSTLEVQLVYADLQDAHGDLAAAVTSPKVVRRALSRFVELTQRLTAVMRKEFRRERDAEWRASEFPGWNEITSLFKDLRNEEQHERQIFISVFETRFYRIFEGDDRLLAFSGTWDLSDQLMEAPPDGITFHPADPKTGQMLPIQLEAVRVEYRFLIQARDQNLGKRLQSIGTSDVHALAAACFATLSDYYAFYRANVVA